MLASQFPAVAQMLLDAKADLSAFSDFPQAHWRKIWSTNPIVIFSFVVDHAFDLGRCVEDAVHDARLSSSQRSVNTG